MTRSLSIAELGAPILRVPADPVNLADLEGSQETISQLLELMQSEGGVGIAAPQVGISQRMIIVASHPTPRYPTAPEMSPVVMVNPVLLDHSDEQQLGWEGCLSVPGIRGQVLRYADVTVSYCDRYGQQQQVTWADFVARVFQHEYDHLQGKLFIDRVASSADLMSEQEYQRRVMGRTGYRRVCTG